MMMENMIIILLGDMNGQMKMRRMPLLMACMGTILAQVGIRR